MKNVLISLGCLMILAGCGPTQKAGDESRTGRRPVNLTVTPDHHRMIVQWQTQGSASFMGYNVYIVPADRASEAVSPFNRAPFPGDTTPDDGIETFEADGLENGVAYKVWVRVQYTDQSQSPSTDTLTAVCGGRGTMSLGVRYNADNDGFSFAGNKSVRANAADNDLYLVSLKGVLYLASPTRLDGFLRSSTFLVLPYKGDFDAISRKVMNDRPRVTEERVIVKKDDWVLVRTADGAHTLLQVLARAGDSDEATTVSFYYAYCPLTDRLFF